MITEIYVIGSIIFSVIVVGLLFFGSEHPSPFLNSLDDALKCPRCGAMMEQSGGGVSWGFVYFFVPPPFVRTCPRCGYSERSWSY